MLDRIGLYYPFIHVRNPEWLKLSALYWPKLARIVPKNYPVSDSPTAAALAQELDLFVDVDPSQAAHAVADRFLEAIAHEPEALRQRYAVSEGALPDTEVRPLALPRFRTWPAETEPPSAWVAGVYWDEISSSLREALFASGLAKPLQRVYATPPTPHPWIALTPELAWVYKCALTGEIARQGQFTPVTDQLNAHSAIGGWDSEGIVRVLLERPQDSIIEEEIVSMVGMMAVRIAVPADLDALPVSKIIKVRRRCRPEFDRFTQAVNETVADLREYLGSITPIEAANAHLHLEVDRRFAGPLEELRRAMKGLKVDTAFSAANLTFEAPAAVASVAGGILADQPLAGATTGAAFAIAGLRRNQTRESRALLAESPVAYLLTLERDMKPDSLLKRSLAKAVDGLFASSRARDAVALEAEEAGRRRRENILRSLPPGHASQEFGIPRDH
ncbi:DUF6236 family protein [Streptomyces sp. NPDC101213]|uniref:DUF6236 family protein n=1 Tax=Streptomyces sp. NPDC101213 TaxID=3366130 RepID=UPI00382327C7